MNKKKVLIIISISVAVVIIILLAVILILSGKDKKPSSELSSEQVADDSGILAQPADITALAETKASFSVKTNLPDPSFQWQYSKDDGENWTDSPSSGNTKDTVTINVVASMDGRLYRCLITSGDQEVETKYALLTVKGIKTQPTDLMAFEGELNGFHIETTVEGAKYQWQYSKDEGKSWIDSPSSGNKTDTVSINIISSMNGRLYRCLVTYGDKVYESEEVRLTVYGFKTQPASQTVFRDEKFPKDNTARFLVETTMETDGYQWQYSEDGGNTWNDAPSEGANTQRLLVRTNDSMNDRLYRCLVTYGKITLSSEYANLIFKEVVSSDIGQ